MLTESVRGGWSVGSPVASFVAPAFRTMIVDSVGSGGSVNVSRIADGAVASVAPFAGSDEARFACAHAVAVPARVSATVAAAVTSTLRITTPPSRSRPWR